MQGNTQSFTSPLRTQQNRFSNLLKRLSYDSNNSWFYEDAKTLMASLDIIYTNIALLSRKTYADENSAGLLNQFLGMLFHILDK